MLLFDDFFKLCSRKKSRNDKMQRDRVEKQTGQMSAVKVTELNENALQRLL